MRLLKRTTAFILSLIMIISLLPSAFALNGEAVLKTLGHSDTDIYTFTNITTRDVTLTVSYKIAQDNANIVDLFNGLIMTYDETKYKNVVVTPADKAEVGGSKVSVTVTFNNLSDADGAEKSSTEYFIKVVSAPPIPAKFSGVINRNVLFPLLVPNPIAALYTITEDEINDMYTQSDGVALEYIIISGSNLVAGTLSHDGNPYVLGTQKIYENAIGTFTFNPEKVGKVSYNINAYDSSDNLIGTAVATFMVYQVPDIKSPITKVGYTGSSVNFSASDFISKCELYNMPLEKIEITPEANNLRNMVLRYY